MYPTFKLNQVWSMSFNSKMDRRFRFVDHNWEPKILRFVDHNWKPKIIGCVDHNCEPKII